MPAHCSRTLVESFETITRIWCRNPDGQAPTVTFEVTTQTDAQQQRTLRLFKDIGVPDMPQRIRVVRLNLS